MRSEKGTYILLFDTDRDACVDVGKLGPVRLIPGYYLYVGSAFGPGGIKARVGRHIKTGKRQHWHIDYVRTKLTLNAAWVSYSGIRKEHDWAAMLSLAEGIEAVNRFGSSDCDCLSHFYWSKDKPDIKSIPGLSAEILDIYYIDR
jgi:Uri superfamily endonuclease